LGRSYLSNHSQALYVGAIELFLSLLLCALLIGLRTMRPLLGRLMLVGLIAGICELFTDASGQQVVHSLIYPPGEVTIWASPVYGERARKPVAFKQGLNGLSESIVRLGSSTAHL
jgi:hypothetical protein